MFWDHLLNLHTEKWKTVHGFAGHYEVSNHGKIRSIKHINAGLMATFLDKDGYECLRLTKDGTRHNVRVHRLVALAFIVNPENHEYVRHIDGNRSNNLVQNLEWVSISQQVTKTYRTTSITRCKAVIGTNVRDGSTVEFDSINKVDAYGFERRNVYRCLRGLQKTNYGYSWKYKTEQNA